MDADMSVIVVEDDILIRDQVVSYLELSGFKVVGVGSAAELYRRLAAESFDVILLDLGLPDEDGLSVAAHIRQRGGVGIIMTTARGEGEDRVKGYDAGADIYMAKPIDFTELVAAVRSLSRRMGTAIVEPNEAADNTIWRFSETSLHMVAPNGIVIRLTSNEIALMQCFLQSNGAIASRSSLLQAMGYAPNDPGNRSLDAALRRLRLKTEKQCGVPLPVQTVHTVGYVFEGKLL